MAHYNKSKKDNDLAGFEELSFQTHSYRPEYALYTDTRRSRRPQKSPRRRVYARDIADILREKTAFLCGLHDRQGRPVISIVASKFDEQRSDTLNKTLRYLVHLPSERSQENGFTFIIDLRGSTWKSAKPIVKTLHETLGSDIHSVIVVKPDAFWERRKSDAGIKKEVSSLGCETTIISSTAKLNQFMDESQLPDELGGPLTYDHEEWIRRRMEIERSADRSPQPGQRKSDTAVSMRTEEDGRRDSEKLMRKDEQLPRIPKKRRSDDRQSRDLKEFDIGFYKIVDWILGPGESYLSTSSKIGDSVKSCEFHKRAHDDFESTARGIIYQFGEVRDLANLMLRGNHYASKDVLSRKDYLDKVCRSFASRMELRRDIVMLSLSFHQNSAVFSNLLEDLLDLLCSDAIMTDRLDGAEKMLSTLEQKVEAVKSSCEETLRDSHGLMQLLRQHTTNAQGESDLLDCDQALQYIQSTVDELKERKQRTDELCDVRRLKLQQILQLRTCERDANQAIEWLEQLANEAVDTSKELGRTSVETHHLQEEHDKVEATAKGTFEYGKQLLQASLVLRRTCRYEMAPNQEMEDKLEQVWVYLSNAMAERGARLSVALMFYRSAEMLMQKIPELRADYVHEYLPNTFAETPVEEVVAAHQETMETIDKEYSETVAMGKALIHRMQLPDDVTRNPHPLEECLQEVEEVKAMFDELWENRTERLNNWKHGEDYGEDVNKFFSWLHNISKQVSRSQWLVGENLQEALSLEASFTKQESEVKVCNAT
ncbi:SEC14 domain and spectrin repeat-containing protein 1-B [Exaiptasia diaphana]|nr:SEC14 domain and spectrin repeat-containing protein 1-B [Exaiptasia diaphana]